MKKLIVGIDPGKKGAVVVLTGYKMYEYFNMPLIGKEYDLNTLNNYFQLFNTNYDVVFYIEKVNAHGMGRTSAFTFGYGVGVLEAYANEYGKLKRVTPQKWQKVMFSGISGKQKPKDKAMQVMAEQYPTELRAFSDYNKADREGLIDAFLIAQYGLKMEVKTNETLHSYGRDERKTC